MIQKKSAANWQRNFISLVGAFIKGPDYEHVSSISHRSYQIIFFHRAIYISSSPVMEGGCATPLPPVSVRYQCICTLLEPHENNSADVLLCNPLGHLYSRTDRSRG